MTYTDERGMTRITATTSNETLVAEFEEWVENEFGGNESKAVKFAIRQAMQREEYE